MNLQTFIIKEIDERGYTMLDLAEMADIKNGNLCRWLQGKGRSIGWNSIRRILLVLNVRFYTDFQPPPHPSKLTRPDEGARLSFGTPPRRHKTSL